MSKAVTYGVSAEVSRMDDVSRMRCNEVASLQPSPSSNTMNMSSPCESYVQSGSTGLRRLGRRPALPEKEDQPSLDLIISPQLLCKHTQTPCQPLLNSSSTLAPPSLPSDWEHGSLHRGRCTLLSLMPSRSATGEQTDRELTYRGALSLLTRRSGTLTVLSCTVTKRKSRKVSRTAESSEKTYSSRPSCESCQRKHELIRSTSTFHDRVEQDLDNTLKELNTDYLDLYLIHWPVRLVPDDKGSAIPLRADGSRATDWDWDQAKTWKQMEEMVAKGKAKAIGVSNCGVPILEHLKKSWKIVPSANQVRLTNDVPEIRDPY